MTTRIHDEDSILFHTPENATRRGRTRIWFREHQVPIGVGLMFVGYHLLIAALVSRPSNPRNNAGDDYPMGAAGWVLLSAIGSLGTGAGFASGAFACFFEPPLSDARSQPANRTNPDVDLEAQASANTPAA